jgi:hypothetical protein
MSERVEFIEEKKEKKELKKGAIKDVLTGSLLASDSIVGQMPFIIFLSFLAIVYIGNRYHAEKLMRKSLLLEKEVYELRAEAISSATELMFASKRSEVVKLVENKGLGLYESLVPPKKIIISKKKNVD